MHLMAHPRIGDFLRLEELFFSKLRNVEIVTDRPRPYIMIIFFSGTALAQFVTTLIKKFPANSCQEG